MEMVKVYDTNYPEEGCTFITRKEYEREKDTYTIVSMTEEDIREIATGV